MEPLTSAPRWFLVLTLGAVASLAVWQEIKWRTSVEVHIAESLSGYQRIAALEARIVVMEAHALWCRQQHKAQ